MNQVKSEPEIYNTVKHLSFVEEELKTIWKYVLDASFILGDI